MERGAQSNQATVEEVLNDLKGRRVGLIKALTTDVEEFYQQCDPGDTFELWKQPLTLALGKIFASMDFHASNVRLPVEEVPPELLEPALGIKFAINEMQKKDWLALVAAQSDAWLLSVVFYFGARFDFDKADRKHLINMINEMPTIYEIVTGAAKKQVKDRSSVSYHSSNKSKSNSKVGKYAKVEVKDEEDGFDEDEEEHGDTLCGACGENDSSHEFWISCDLCERWFHGKCVKITARKAEHIKKYKCPSCKNKSPRP